MKPNLSIVSVILGFVNLSIFISSCNSDRRDDQLFFRIFGKPIANCVQIINSQDHQAYDDASAWLNFKICSSELNRILSQKEYSRKIITKLEASRDETATYGGAIPKWWTPSKLGDSCVKYEFYDAEQNTARKLYVSMDQEVVYCRDMNMTP